MIEVIVTCMMITFNSLCAFSLQITVPRKNSAEHKNIWLIMAIVENWILQWYREVMKVKKFQDAAAVN